jgi:hypothetical protein
MPVRLILIDLVTIIIIIIIIFGEAYKL